MNKRTKKVLFVCLAVILSVFLLISWFYLVGINTILKSDFAINKIQNIVKSNLDMDLEIYEPNIKTHLKPVLDFKVKNLTLKKGDTVLIQLKDFVINSQYSIFKKEYILHTLKASSLTINADKLIENFPELSSNKEKSNWKLNFYNADLRLDNLRLIFKQKNNTKFDLSMKNVFIDLSGEDKYLGFNFDALILKEDKTYAKITSYALNEIKLFKDYLKINDLRVFVNNSKLRLDVFINCNTVDVDAKSELFYLEDIFKLVQSNFIVNNGSELLKPLVEPRRNVNFKINYKNGDLSGDVNVNNTRAKLKDVTFIPINISQGKIIITKDKVYFDKLSGFWGKNKNNIIEIEGTIKDYHKTFDSDIVVDTIVNNEFLGDYLAPLINNTKLVISKPCKTRVVYKAKNAIMNIVWLARLPKGVSLGTDDKKTNLSEFERFIKGDFEIKGDDFNVNNINYYIAPDIKRGVKLTPILILDAKMKLNGKLKEIGFSFGKEIPSEILNIFIQDNVFKKGTIKGNLHVIYKGSKAYLDSDMEINKVLVPTQRLFIKSANLTTTPEFIFLKSSGGFKRAKYDLDTKIVNKIDTPIVLKNLNLHLDNLDIERFLSATSTTDSNVDNEKIKEAETIVDDNYMFDTNLLRIENADFMLDKGKYKDIDFANVKAKMSLDDKGILKLSSNRFDIAQGHSSLKSECDLVNLKYNIKLGVKDVDSDLIAKTLFNLNKEIAGKAWA